VLAFLEGPELIIVLVIVLLVFGGSKLPQLARSLGEAQREFRNASQDAGTGQASSNPSADQTPPAGPDAGGGPERPGA
jgi:sec-independent protein translocase protein TatA